MHAKSRVAIIGLLMLRAASATSVPQLSFEQLTDTSDLIATGSVTQSWTAWDAEHKYIWTHYQLSVSSVKKGAAGSSVEFAEPGGAVDGVGMAIAGSVSYRTGENVLIFLQRMPNGYLRTTGWGQGKYSIDGAGRLRAAASLRGLEIVDGKSAAAAPVRSLDGMTVTEASQRIADRVRAAQSTERGQ
jgi:hypothetical protein